MHFILPSINSSISPNMTIENFANVKQAHCYYDKGGASDTHALECGRECKHSEQSNICSAIDRVEFSRIKLNSKIWSRGTWDTKFRGKPSFSMPRILSPINPDGSHNVEMHFEIPVHFTCTSHAPAALPNRMDFDEHKHVMISEE